MEGKETPEKLKELLKASTRVHSVVSRDAAYGRGVDRHFLGLKLASILSGGSMPELFADKAAQLEYMLSTSQTPLVQEDMKSIPKEKVEIGAPDEIDEKHTCCCADLLWRWVRTRCKEWNWVQLLRLRRGTDFPCICSV